MLFVAREHAQRELRAARRKRLRHRQQRRHADAAGQQQVVRGFLAQRKGVARRADRQQVALAHALVHRGRTAAAGELALHADHVGAGAEARASEYCREKPPGTVHVDMRARLVGRSGRPHGVGQLEGQDFRVCREMRSTRR